jgi:hypothetical protein
MSDKSEFNKILSPGSQDYSANQKGNNTPIAKVDSHSQRQATLITERPLGESTPRHHWISVAAYYNAQARGFEPGKELNDWLKAEKDYSSMLVALYLSVSKEDGGMTISGLQQLAKSIGVQNSEHMSLEIELIQAIQNISQHRPCFRSENHMLCGDVDVVSCEWRAECRKLIAVWCR